MTELGVCQWFHYRAHRDVERAVEELHALGCRHLRTGISWADFHRPNGPEWYEWQMDQLADFDVLLSVWHTPPSIAEGAVCEGPPVRLGDYADFIGQLIDLYGHRFEALELWNEPNNRIKWDFRRFDPNWSKFARMVGMAAEVAADAGVPTVLGGMIPVDPSWLQLVASQGAIDDVDAVAIHGFPGMWWDDEPNWDWYQHWHGWQDKVEQIEEVSEGRPVWITETGLATWDLDAGRPGHFRDQSDRLLRAAEAPAERVYWYSLIDLDPRRAAIEGFHVDENEYHLGLVRYDGTRKPAWRTMCELLKAPTPERIRG